MKIISLAAIILMLTGCAIMQDQRDEIRAAIIEYVETKGQAAAIDYIDKLVEDGKLGATNAEKIKAAIPQGIEKLKETMKTEE